MSKEIDHGQVLYVYNLFLNIMNTIVSFRDSELSEKEKTEIFTRLRNDYTEKLQRLSLEELDKFSELLLAYYEMKGENYVH